MSHKRTEAQENLAFQLAQDRCMPREDLRPYAGQWIAVRDGRVAAHDEDGYALVAADSVFRSDLVMYVPRVATDE